jgi:leucyl-tRNA synthetase
MTQDHRQYDHQAIETKWQARWDADRTFATPADRTRPKFYVLDMFPYPSGAGLHVGHPKGYVATDIVARAKRMMGHNVLRVMGWDSFGLPAERQAVKEGKHPAEITQRNIATFKSQLQRLGLSYDWEHELATSDPEYYRWTQWIFLQMFEKGLAYQHEVPVNWCPALGTVLANEEVKDGVYIETGDPVEQRSMKQWMLKITDYAESLLEGLETLDWPEGILEQQRHWIGKSQGAEIDFEIEGHEGKTITVFTTRPDTLCGGTYMVLAPEHPLVDEVTVKAQRATIETYREEVGKKSDRDRMAQAADAPKTGANTGAYAINPATGAKMPIWIADYVLATYGTGAVFACPAHDERDWAFAKSFGLPMIEVVGGGDIEKEAFIGDGPHVNSDFDNGLNTLNGLQNAEAIERMTGWLEQRGRGRGTVNYRLRDWLFSRQRYWGEPFPILLTEDGEAIPVPEEMLPVELPEQDEYTPTADGRPPLARNEAWVNTTTPDGRPAKRETNTMPQWAGSCWYYLRFITPRNKKAAWDAAEEHHWMPVDLYVGGAEHATLHLLYARFWHHVLHDLGLVTTREPFQRLFNQGMILAHSHRDERGRFYYPDEIEERGGSFVAKESGGAVEQKLEKMSKSRHNVVNPDDVCREQGADSMRLYEVFMGPLDERAIWETSGVAGVRRFLDRAWRLVIDSKTGDISEKIVAGDVDDPETERLLHGAIKKVTESVESLKFNTAISEMMIFVNQATQAEALAHAWVEAFVRILAPFAPHMGEELWQRLGHEELLTYAEWPAYDEAKLKVDTITIAVQVMGKVRVQIEIPADASEADAIAAAKENDKIASLIDGKTIRKEIYVPGRLVNIVAN